MDENLGVSVRVLLVFGQFQDLFRRFTEIDPSTKGWKCVQIVDSKMFIPILTHGRLCPAEYISQDMERAVRSDFPTT